MKVKEHFLFPQLTDVGFVHEPPIVKLCNGLIAEALSHGFERLEFLAPERDSAISEVRAVKDGVGSRYFELPASTYLTVVRRLKVMAKMRRIRPTDEQGTIRVERARGAPIEISVTTKTHADGTEDIIMTLPALP